MSDLLHDPTWDEPGSPAQIWRQEWAQRHQAHRRAAHYGFVFTHAQCELSRAEVRSLLRRRIWSAPRAGVLAVLHPSGDRNVQAALAATAAALVRRDTVISHASAAILHGLPVLRTPRGAVVTIPPHAPDGAARALHVHRATLKAHEIVG